MLFEPFKLKNCQMRNRIVMAPMTRNQSPGGIPTEEVAKYYERRAKGEVGLIITEGIELSHKSSSAYPNVPRLDSEEARDGWKKVISGIKENNGSVIAQLWHCGGFRKLGMGPDPDVPGYTASGLVKPGKKVAHEMTADDVKEAIEAYASDAEICENLGFDGVELHGAHGYLIDNFFWEGTNQRADGFGGSIDKRTAFACEIVKRARAKVGTDFPIAIRFSQWKQQDFEAKLAYTEDDLKTFLMPLVDAGIDMFHASNRRYWEPEFEGSDLNLAGWTKKLTGLPTITVGSVGLKSDFIGMYAGDDAVESQSIDDLIERMESDEFDMVAIGRALLSDPEWVKKVKTGDFEAIIPFEKKYASEVYY